MSTVENALENEEPAWLRDGRAHVRRVLRWSMVGTVVVGVAGIGLLQLPSPWWVVPVAGLALCQVGVYYAIVRGVMLSFRVKKEGVEFPPLPLRTVLRRAPALPLVGALCLVIGVIGLVYGQTVVAVYAFLGFGFFLYWLFAVWRRHRNYHRTLS